MTWRSLEESTLVRNGRSLRLDEASPYTTCIEYSVQVSSNNPVVPRTWHYIWKQYIEVVLSTVVTINCSFHPTFACCSQSPTMATSTSISAASLFDVSGIVAVVTGGGSGKLTTEILLNVLINRELTNLYLPRPRSFHDQSISCQRCKESIHSRAKEISP